MPRGKKPFEAIKEAKGFAERMGYRCSDNPHEDLQFDFEIFKSESVRLIKVVTSRFRLDPGTYSNQIYPKIVAELRAVPYPPSIPRELWLRTQHERSWRRFLLDAVSVSEIEWWGPDGYTNKYAR